MNPKKTTTDKGKDPKDTATGAKEAKGLKTQTTSKDVNKVGKDSGKTIGNKTTATATKDIIGKDSALNLKKQVTIDDKNVKHQRNVSDISGVKTGTAMEDSKTKKAGITKLLNEKVNPSPIKRPSVTPTKKKEEAHSNQNTQNTQGSYSELYQNKEINLIRKGSKQDSISNFESEILTTQSFKGDTDTNKSIETLNMEKDITNTNTNNSNNSNTNLEINTSSTPSQNFVFSTVTDDLKNQLSQKEQEVAQLKKVFAEKKELQDQLLLTKRERDEWHKKFEEQDLMVNTCLKELEDYSRQIDNLIRSKEELEGKLFISKEENKVIHKENDNLNNKLAEMELEVEIKKEEIEFCKIELETANLNLENLSRQETNKTQINFSPLNENEATAKIKELEIQIKKLTSTLIKVSEDRNSEANYFKNELDNLNVKLANANKNLEEITKRDDIIKHLNKKIHENENIIIDLKEELVALSSASNMLDDLITQKTQLEIDYNREKEENDILKGEMETTELLIQELESASKISNDIVREKENEILEINNKVSLFKLKIEENDSKEKQLINIITDLKNQNKIIREEISKNKNLNVEEILNRNLNQNTRLKTLQRQKVLNILSLIDISKLNLRNKIIAQMIPKKTFSKGYIESFDKFLLTQSLRKKTLNIIFNILENDLLQGILSESENGLSNSSNQDSVEEENNKTLITFIKNALQTLIDFNNFLFNLEILITTFNPHQFKSIVDNIKNNIFTNISAAAQFIDNLITLIKDDSFGVKYQFEGLKIIVKTLNDEFKNYLVSLSIEENEFKNNYPIIQYTNELLSYVFNMLISFKQDKINILQKNKNAQGNINFKELTKFLGNVYKQFKKTLKKIDEKFFTEFSFEDSKKIFDFENSYYIKLITVAKNSFGNEITEENFYPKFDNLADTVSKFCVVVLSYIEKFDKEFIAKMQTVQENSEKEGNNAKINLYSFNNSYSNSGLPLKTWGWVTSEVFNELESGIQIKEELDEANNKLKQFKLEKLELESKIEELHKNKSVNDRKLGEALIQAGKVAQLEADIEEQNKKIAKYNTTIEALVKNIESEQEKNKDLRVKLENAVSFGAQQNLRPGIDTRQSKRGALIGSSLSGSANNNPLGIKLSNSNNFMTDSVPLLNTICELQRERKILKSKLMKDKLSELFNENSYVNRYISKNKKENLEFYEQVKDNVENLNNHYKTTRKELCLPKIYDISEETKENNFESYKKEEENKICKIRIDYMSEVDKILTNMFGDHTLDRTFKDMIENDISRTLNYFGEKRLLVGRIRFTEKENFDKNINDSKTVTVTSTEKVKMKTKNTKVIPLFMSEKNLKILNKSFLH